jgi:hypothetical protein
VPGVLTAAAVFGTVLVARVNLDPGPPVHAADPYGDAPKLVSPSVRATTSGATMIKNILFAVPTKDQVL